MKCLGRAQLEAMKEVRNALFTETPPAAQAQWTIELQTS